jgi:hypothetical protein
MKFKVKEHFVALHNTENAMQRAKHVPTDGNSFANVDIIHIYDIKCSTSFQASFYAEILITGRQVLQVH